MVWILFRFLEHESSLVHVLKSKADFDILFVHAPASEKKFISTGFGEKRQQVMYNDFVIVGPKKDPASVMGMNPSPALQKIKNNSSKFFSRGDNSGTNKKELSLWKNAKVDTKAESSWYVQTGQGMLELLIWLLN